MWKNGQQLGQQLGSNHGQQLGSNHENCKILVYAPASMEI